MSLNHDRAWKSWEKILFRLFFPFLTLQILTQDFTGNLFGGSHLVWDLGERIFTRPGLWLNDHFFHFTYQPPAWTTFSAALHTIRDTVYLLLSIVICIVWTLFDKHRTNYNRLHYWFSQVLVMALSCIAFAYGVVKVFPVQMAAPSFSVLQTPVGDLRPFDLLWATYGYGSPYQMLTGFCEAGSAILILFRRTRVAGLLILASVMVNVILLNYTFQIGVLMLSFYVLLVALFLLAPYAWQLARLFFSGQEGTLAWNGYVPGRGLKTIIPRVTAGVLIAASFLANTLYVHSVYERRETVRRSAEYSQVQHFVMNSDTLRPSDNDTICWRWWNERTTSGKRYVTITPVKIRAAKTYTVERDTSKRILTLKPMDRKDSVLLRFNYTDLSASRWRLEGIWGQNRVRAEFLRINPDTTCQLLKVRRTIIPLDDEK
jgi:hypothetical protein